MYSDLDVSKVKKSFNKVVDQLRAGNFAGADVKKMSNTGYYRAKLDEENRLLFKFGRCGDHTYLLLLEVILHHNYAASRFLGGAAIDEQKAIPLPSAAEVTEADVEPLPYVNPRSARFHLLNKVISFDDDQQEALQLPTPLIIIGSAGSGKTALTLEKVKALGGQVLYVTLSSFLVENAAALYASFGYRNDAQEIDFLAFKEYVETIGIPSGKEITFRAFEQWFTRYRSTVKIRDAYKLYEEFKGVLTGANTEKAYLTREDYLGLGVRQSVFPADERPQVYELFEKYLQFLQENNYYDLNMVAFNHLERCQPKYDFVVVDEVQDLTNVQLLLILRSLKTPGQFLLCGDANQIVHPNYFSWANVKTMFYLQENTDNTVRILHTNYRNSPQVTEVANRLLKLKNARFGSIDRESTYLVNPISEKMGEVVCLPDNPKIKKELDEKTRLSAQFAVIVMGNEDKAEARTAFKTPLVFSVQEAKGLEYPNIILYKFVSGKSREFIDISEGVSRSDVEAEDIRYARARDKSDKSLDAYKFYINALYVAITRAVSNLYVLEDVQKHPLLNLLGLTNLRDKLELQTQQSSIDEWQREARRLEMQGKNEQADLIRSNILGTQKTPWTPVTIDELPALREQALNPDVFNKKAKDRLFDYALIYNDQDTLRRLAELKYRRAERPENERSSIFRRIYAPYAADNVKMLAPNLKKYGIDYRDEFNMTPLLAALKTGAAKIADFLIENGARLDITDNYGANPFTMALQQANTNDKFLQLRLPLLYDKLKPEAIRIKVNNQLVKVNARSAEYFLLHNFLVAQPLVILRKKPLEDKGLNMDDVEALCAKFPDALLPAFRKKRQYLNSILSKNEIDRDDQYNKKLFIRLLRGVYVLNPELDVLVEEGRWMNVYDMMFSEKMTRQRNETIKKAELEALRDKIHAERERARLKQQADREREWMNRWNW
jgi:hypothetical protein